MIDARSHTVGAINSAAIVVLCVQMVFYLLILEGQAYRLIIAPSLSELINQSISATQLDAHATIGGSHQKPPEITLSVDTVEKVVLLIFPPTASTSRCIVQHISASSYCRMLINAVGIDALRTAAVYGLLSCSQLVIVLLSTSTCWLVTRHGKHRSPGSTRILSLNHRKAATVAGVLFFLSIGTWQLITSFSASLIVQMADRVLTAEAFVDAVRRSNQSFWAGSGMILVALIFSWEIVVLVAGRAKSHSKSQQPTAN